MSNILEADIRPMTQSDLDMVLAWRNHPAVRQHMLTQHIITPDEHHAWFAMSQQMADRRIMLVERHAQAFGLVHFSGLRPHASVDWGFYVAPDAPKGSGRLLGIAALRFAFENLICHKLCGQVLGSNAASIRFHERLGFKAEGRLRKQVFVAPAYEDLLCYGLLREEWLRVDTLRSLHD
jgi:UDP-4-amino-4,6-dideoxy-N-acetyl-beta-L-altrosamine N-acetyltransferase